MSERTKNTKRNILAGVFSRLVIIILPFINLTAILWILGAEYTGLGSLFKSILQVLNIAELGFNTAIVYSLYEPMANHDENKIRQLVSMFKRIYNIVGCVVLCGGLLAMPFLTKLINGTYPDDINLYLLFGLYLVNSVLSYYLFAYKECLLIADQKRDIADYIRTFVNIGTNILQFVVLLITHNFYCYLLVAICGTVTTNILLHIATKKRYTFYYDQKEKIAIPETIKKQVKGLLVDRLGDTCRNSFDNVIITAFFGLTLTAIYGNYYYIYSALYMMMLVICNAMGASVGNSIVKESPEKNYNNLEQFTCVFSWLAGWCTVCLLCLYQPFMRIWAGDELLLSDNNMFLFCLYFYVINMTNIRNQYISGTGIWWKLKIPCIIEALANLCLNIVLGKLLGVSGVIIATILTIFFLNFTWRTSILFKEYFVGHKFSRYMLQYLYYLGVTLVACIITYRVCGLIGGSTIVNIVIRLVICLVLPNIILFLGYRPLKQFSSSKQFVLRVLRKQ